MAILLGAEAGAEPVWGEPNAEGLATRLVAIADRHRIGGTILFRLEAKNTGPRMIYADMQELAQPGKVLKVCDEAGAAVPMISPPVIGCEPLPTYTAFPPGEVVVVAGRIDASEDFEIVRAGVYRFRHPGIAQAVPELEPGQAVLGNDGKRLDARTLFTRLPASPEIRLEVEAGELPRDLELITRLRPILPPTWFLSRRGSGEGVQLETGARGGTVRIELVVSAPDAPLEDGHRRLGGSPLGEIRMGVVGSGSDDDRPEPLPARLGHHWPGAEAAIRDALGVVPSDA